MQTKTKVKWTKCCSSCRFSDLKLHSCTLETTTYKQVTKKLKYCRDWKPADTIKHIGA